MNENIILVYRPDGMTTSENVAGTVLRKTKTLVEVSFEHPSHPGVSCIGTFSLKNGHRVRADACSCREWWLKSY